MEWLTEPAGQSSEPHQQSARSRQAILTKPPGSLGLLEDIAIRLAGLQAKECPQINRIAIRIFAGDHGVTEEGVSAFPQVVTGEMIKNFARGGAAISVLAKALDADFGVLNMGTVVDLEPLPGVQSCQISAGTANFCKQAAMTKAELEQALQVGQDCANEAAEQACDLFIGGEMGIGNTTSASALCAALTNRPLNQWVGRGTGVDQDGIARKHHAIERALALHDADSPLEWLRCVGGLEIAGLVGAYIACAQRGTPVLVDGFISSAAALVALRINPSIQPWLFFSHCSDESGHLFLLEELQATPLVSLGMRLGEASGAAVCVPLMRSACQLHASMATFEQAGVSNQDD